jgi:CubicO group peptidase (beta-lactamase class C family)
MKSTVLFCIYSLVCSLYCFGQNSYQYSRPATLPDGWETASFFSDSMDTTRINNLFGHLFNENHQIHSILLARNNQLVLEEYFHQYEADTRHDMRSVTKSVRSLLVGLAVDRGIIGGIDDPISKYILAPIPEKNHDLRKERITIRHLLTMSTGLDCNDWDKKSRGREDRVYRKKDWLQYTLNLPMVGDPGDSSFYCSMGTVLAAEAVRQASGMPIDAFAGKFLFGPLGIENVGWGHTAKGTAVIPSARRLFMTPRDMLKVGQLVLNKGLWDGKQLVSEAWINEMLSLQSTLAGIEYGFLWWRIPYDIHSEKILAYTATGNGGQYIMVFPSINTVMVFTGGAYNSEEDKLPFIIVRDVLLPLLIDNYEK